MLKTIFLFFLIISNLFLPAQALEIGQSDQILQITTRFQNVYGRPTWLLIVRNVNTGKVLPYIYDVKKENNYWIALTSGQAYRVTASTLKWGPFAQIHNFCNLENGILIRKSMIITLTGDLSPDKKRFRCTVVKYAD